MSPQIRTFLITASTLTALLFSILLFNYGEAEANSPVKLRELSVDFFQYWPGGTNVLVTDNGMPDRHLDKDLDLTMKTDVFGFCFWNSRIHSTTDKDSNGSGQFRLVGLELDFGFRPWSWLDVYLEKHHSQHEMDYAGPWHFPVQDQIGFRLFLIRDGKFPSIFK